MKNKWAFLLWLSMGSKCVSNHITSSGPQRTMAASAMRANMHSTLCLILAVCIWHQFVDCNFIVILKDTGWGRNYSVEWKLFLSLDRPDIKDIARHVYPLVLQNIMFSFEIPQCNLCVQPSHCGFNAEVHRLHFQLLQAYTHIWIQSRYNLWRNYEITSHKHFSVFR